MFRKLLLFFVLGASFICNAQINLVKDFYEGSGKNGNPFFFGVFKDKLIFNANTTLINIESYSYDGTTVENITDSNGNIVKITPIYFPDEGADDPMIITMLESSVLKTFKYDGTNFSKISDNRAMGGGIKFNGKYYFTAEIGSKYPLCFTDLTEGGTGFLKEDAKTFVNWNPTERAVVNNTLVFVADTSEEGIELWKTDGTEDGTTILKDIYTGSSDSKPEDFFVTEDKSKMFFTAKTQNEGRELWVTDGTESGTKLLKDIHSGTSGDDVNSITEMNGNVYFEANGKLWKTDGTPENTLELADADERYLIVLNNELFFHDSKSMFKTDGTVAGTSQVNASNVGVEWRSYPILYNNAIYFGGSILDSNGQISGNEVWKTDGTTAGTVKVKTIDSELSTYPQYFTIVGNVLIFNAVTKSEGQELWRTDGTEAGTMMIQDKVVGSSGFIANLSNSWSHMVYKNNLMLRADALDGNGTELYEYKNEATASVVDNSSITATVIYYNSYLNFKSKYFDNASVQVYSILGKQVLNTEIDSNTNGVYLPLKNGVYIANLKTKNGEIVSKKFLVN